VLIGVLLPVSWWWWLVVVTCPRCRCSSGCSFLCRGGGGWSWSLAPGVGAHRGAPSCVVVVVVAGRGHLPQVSVPMGAPSFPVLWWRGAPLLACDTFPRGWRKGTYSEDSALRGLGDSG
jgi:hypothetical protein